MSSIILYDARAWYWIVAGDQTRVYASARQAYVPVDDPTYTEWLTAGGIPTAIDTEMNLGDSLQAAGIANHLPKSSFIAADLVAQLTAADYTAIQSTISANGSLGVLWSALLAQGTVPIAVTSNRFEAGWAGIVQALGNTRAGQIAATLGISP